MALNIFKKKTFSSTKVENTTPEVEALGTSGTDIYGGDIDEEYLSELLGADGQQVYKNIVRSDYNAAMCVKAVVNSIRSTPYEIQVEANDDDGERKKLLCERVLSDTLTPYSQIMDEMLSIVQSGFYTGEITFKNVLSNPITDSDGKIIFQSYTGINDIAYRAQTSIDKWITDKHGRLLGVNQKVYGDLAVDVNIMSDALVHIAIEQQGSNFEGISMLRPAYGCYKRKNKYLKFNAIGIESYAVPFIKGTMPKGADDVSKAAFSVALKSIMAKTKNFLRLGEGYTVEIDNTTYNPTFVEQSVDKEDARMTRAFLANFLLLGQASNQGSRAVSNDLGDFFINGLEYIAGKIEAALNKELKRVQIANLGEQSNYAKFKIVGISDRFGSEMATILSAVTTSGIITPDDKLEASTRKRLGLPEADFDTRKEVDEDEETPVTLSEKVRRRWSKK